MMIGGFLFLFYFGRQSLFFFYNFLPLHPRNKNKKEMDAADDDCKFLIEI